MSETEEILDCEGDEGLEEDDRQEDSSPPAAAGGGLHAPEPPLPSVPSDRQHTPIPNPALALAAGPAHGPSGVAAPATSAAALDQGLMLDERVDTKSATVGAALQRIQQELQQVLPELWESARADVHLFINKQASSMNGVRLALKKAMLQLEQCSEEKRRLAKLLENSIAEKDVALEQLEAVKLGPPVEQGSIEYLRVEKEMLRHIVPVMTGFGEQPCSTIIATIVQLLREKAAVQTALTAAEDRLQRGNLHDHRSDTPQRRYGVFEGGRLEGGYAGPELRPWPFVPQPPPRQQDSPAGDRQRQGDQRDCPDRS